MKKNGILVILLALVACNSSTSSLNETPTSLPTETPTPTNTPIVLPSPTIKPSPTWTPLPTIPPENVQDTILDWIETNRDCSYPCWWGIVPGETDWNTAKALLDTISPQWWIPDNGDFVEVIFPLPDNWRYDSKGSADIYINDGMVESIRAFTDIPLAEFFKRYGMPDEIWISYKMGAPPYFNYLYFIGLHYPHNGITLLFGEEVFENDGDKICPYRSFVPETLIRGDGNKLVIDHRTIGLALWNPESQLSFNEVLIQHYPGTANSVEFKPLDQMTDLTAQAFLEIISDKNSRTCVEIKK
jgi:hypothetical protein